MPSRTSGSGDAEEGGRDGSGRAECDSPEDIGGVVMEIEAQHGEPDENGAANRDGCKQRGSEAAPTMEEEDESHGGDCRHAGRVTRRECSAAVLYRRIY